MHTWHLKQAVRCLQQGGLLAYPTEAVWGLGCDPWNRDAVLKLLKLKQRPQEKGLILVASDRDQIRALIAGLAPSEQQLLDESWPGPSTWLIPDPQQRIPSWIKGRFDTVAIRVSAHKGVQALCHAFGGPVVSTSANLAGQSPAKTPLSIQRTFGDRIDYLLPGSLGGLAQPTTIRDLKTGRTFRASS